MNTIRSITRTAATAAAAATAVVGISAGAHAAPSQHPSVRPDYVGQVVSVGYGTTSGVVQLNSFSSHSWSATAYMTKTGGAGCYYIEAKPTAGLAVDGDWKRKSGNFCQQGRYVPVSMSDSFHLAYTGVKFRVCYDVSWGSDSCGSAVSVRGW